MEWPRVHVPRRAARLGHRVQGVDEDQLNDLLALACQVRPSARSDGLRSSNGCDPHDEPTERWCRPHLV